MRLLESSWSEMLILDQIHQRMHNHLPDETTLANGQKFELLSLALLGVPSMSDAFNELTGKLSNLKFDTADYVCLKFILLLSPGKYLIKKNQLSKKFKKYWFSAVFLKILSKLQAELDWNLKLRIKNLDFSFFLFYPTFL